MTTPSTFKPVSSPRPGETAWLWLVKIVTGPLLFLIFILHLVVNHYLGSTASGLMTYDDVVAYFQNPLIPAIEIIFVTAVVTHSLVGLRGIVLDMNPSRPALNAVTVLLVALGAAAIGYGIWLALVIAAKGL